MTVSPLDLQIQQDSEDMRAQAAQDARQEDMSQLCEILRQWGAESILHELKAFIVAESKGRLHLEYRLEAKGDREAFAFGYDDNSHIAQYDEF